MKAERFDLLGIQFPQCSSVVGRVGFCLLPDARIRQRIKEVGHKIHDDIGEADHEDRALNQVVIAIADSLNGQPSDAGPGKDCLGHDGSGEQRTKLQTYNGQHRNQSIAQSMFVDHYVF